MILGTQILCISIPKCIAGPLDHIIFGEKNKKIVRQSNTQNTWVQRIHRGRRQHWVWGVVVIAYRDVSTVSMSAKRTMAIRVCGVVIAYNDVCTQYTYSSTVCQCLPTIATRVCVVVIAYVYSMHILLQDYTSMGVQRA